MPKKYLRVLVILCLFVWGSLGFLNAYGVFYQPMADALGVGQGDITFHMSISNLMAGLAAPFVAARLEKGVPLSRVLWAGLALFLGSGLVIALSPNVLLINLAAFFRGAGYSILSMMVATMVIGNWFESSRGTVSGIVLSFSGVGSALSSPIFSSLIEDFGYRPIYFLYLALSAALVLPAIFTLTLKPAEKNMVPYFVEDEEKKDAIEQTNLDQPFMYKSLSFIFLTLLEVFCLLGIQFGSHLASVADYFGFTATFAGSLLSAAMVGNVSSKFFFGVLSDLVGSFTASGVVLGLAFAGLAILFMGRGSAVLMLIGAFLFGMLYSMGSLACSLITRHIYGDEQYARAYSVGTLAISVSSAVGVSLYGFINDISGGYESAILMAMLMIVAAIIMLFLLALRVYVRNRRHTTFDSRASRRSQSGEEAPL